MLVREEADLRATTPKGPRITLLLLKQHTFDPTTAQPRYSISQPLLPDSPRTDCTASNEYHTYAQGRSRSLAIAFAYNVLQMRLQTPVIRKTCSHAFCDFVSVLIAVECSSKT